jgi:hypothetical protein
MTATHPETHMPAPGPHLSVLKLNPANPHVRAETRDTQRMHARVYAMYDGHDTTQVRVLWSQPRADTLLTQGPAPVTPAVLPAGYTHSIHSTPLLPHLAALAALGMIWEPRLAGWERGIAAARRYHRQHGDLNVPHAYQDADGYRLGAWLLHQRQLRSGIKQGGLPPERVSALNELGMRW